MPIVATLPSFMRHKSESDRRRKATPAGSGDGRGTGEGTRRGRVTAAKTRNKKWGKNMQTSLGKTCARIFPAAFRAFYFTYFCVVGSFFPLENGKQHQHQHQHKNSQAQQAKKLKKKTCNNSLWRVFIHFLMRILGSFFLFFFLAVGREGHTQGAGCAGVCVRECVSA